MFDSSVLPNLSTRLRAWVLHNHSLNADLRLGTANVRLEDNGTGIISITQWDLDCPQPTQADLLTLSDSEVDSILKSASKSKFPEVASNLIQTDPKFALVYDMIKAVCVEKLNMSEQEYVELSQSVYEAWVDKQ